MSEFGAKSNRDDNSAERPMSDAMRELAALMAIGDINHYGGSERPSLEEVARIHEQAELDVIAMSSLGKKATKDES